MKLEMWIFMLVCNLIVPAVMILNVIPVERALKKTFDKHGNRR